MTATSKVLDALHSGGFKPRQESEGQWGARCPSHDDSTASLSIGLGADGKVLLHCHAGCQVRDILGALGLSEKDLFEEPAPKPTRTATGKPRIVTEYGYTDEGGKLLFQVCRFEPKTFRQRKPNEKGGWDWKVAGVRKVPYRLPEVLAAIKAGQDLWIVEGEKDADSLVSIGLAATCNAGGAGKWGADHSKSLTGARRVFIVPDNDEPGSKHAETVAKGLKTYGVKARIVNLPEGAKDASAWIAQGHTADDLQALTVLPLERRIFNAAELAEHDFPPLRWAVPGLLPAGLSLLTGPPKAAKSFFALNVLASIAAGQRVLGVIEVEQGPVLYLALEDSPRRLQGRLRKLGSKADKDLYFSVEPGRLSNGIETRIEGWLGEHPDARAVVVDTLGRVRPPRGKGADEYQAATDELANLQALAVKHDVAVILIHHTRKMGATDGDFLESVLGSQGLAGAADAVLVLRRPRCENTATLQVTGREMPEAELALDFDGDTGRWKLLGDAETVLASPERRAVVDAIRAADRPLAPKEIVEAVAPDGDKKTRDACRRLVYKLTEKGILERSIGGGYRLPPSKDGGILGDNDHTSSKYVNNIYKSSSTSVITPGSHPITPITPEPENAQSVTSVITCDRGGDHTSKPSNSLDSNEKDLGVIGVIDKGPLGVIAARLGELGARVGQNKDARHHLTEAYELVDAGNEAGAGQAADRAEAAIGAAP